ncbi:MAG: LysR family transcriptional regulator [Bdellovibrionales bacterium]|nr:LysR family transcriptional regulator [Bdellovibrionales bacterium]
MNISSIYLKAFYQLAQDKNFTKAASNLAITQSAFSQRILNLEEELGATLFIRERQNIRLTETGELLLRYCEKVFRLEEEFLLDVKEPSRSGELAGSVRVGGFSSVLRSCLLPSLQSLLRDNPKLSLTILSVELDELFDLLKTSKVDFVLSNKEPQEQAIKSTFLGYEYNVLVESKKYPFAGNYLDHDSEDVTTSSYFKLKPGLASNIKKRYLDDVYGLIDGVKLGLGRAVLPEHLIRHEKDLKVLFPKTKLKVPVYLLYYESAYQTRVERSVIEAISKFFSVQLAH